MHDCFGNLIMGYGSDILGVFTAECLSPYEDILIIDDPMTLNLSHAKSVSADLSASVKKRRDHFNSLMQYNPYKKELSLLPFVDAVNYYFAVEYEGVLRAIKEKGCDVPTGKGVNLINLMVQIYREIHESHVECATHYSVAEIKKIDHIIETTLLKLSDYERKIYYSGIKPITNSFLEEKEMVSPNLPQIKKKRPLCKTIKSIIYRIIQFSPRKIWYQYFLTQNSRYKIKLSPSQYAKYIMRVCK